MPRMIGCIQAVALWRTDGKSPPRLRAITNFRIDPWAEHACIRVFAQASPICRHMGRLPTGESRLS
jgi:hypothetical protein